MKNICFLLCFLSSGIFAQSYHSSILKEIENKAIESHSDALIIVQNGKTLYQNFYSKEEKPIYLASAGKSLLSLGIGKLIDQGLIDSLDQAVHSFFPEWKQGQKKEITIRMLLNHSSGLQNHPNASVELEPAPDFQIDNIIQLALCAEINDPPGSKVSYNNKAVALLGGIIEKASGKRMDHYFQEHFYRPMGIQEYDWIRDKSGNPTAHGAFLLKASDFLKFGQLILQKGQFKGKQIISQEWIEKSVFAAGQTKLPIWGLLWWRLPSSEKRIIDQAILKEWKVAGVDSVFVERLKPIFDKEYASKQAFFNALEAYLGPNWNEVMNQHLGFELPSSRRIYSDKILAYYANGYRGNYLVIIPEYNIVAVRCADPNGFNYQTDFFPDFVSLIAKLGKK